ATLASLSQCLKRTQIIAFRASPHPVPIIAAPCHSERSEEPASSLPHPRLPIPVPVLLFHPAAPNFPLLPAIQPLVAQLPRAHSFQGSDHTWQLRLQTNASTLLPSLNSRSIPRRQPKPCAISPLSIPRSATNSSPLPTAITSSSAASSP